MTYVFAMTSWVESSLFAIVCFSVPMPGFRLLSFGGSASSSARMSRKSRFRHRDRHALHALHAFAKEKVLGRRSRIPVSCAGFLVFNRPLFARVRDATSAKGSLDSTSLHLSKPGPIWQPGYTATNLHVRPGLHALVGPAHATRVHVLTYLG